MYSLYVSLGIDNSKINPQFERKYTGLNVKFQCNLDNPYWFHKKPAGKILSKSHEYSIPLVSLKNGGYYYCFGKKRNKETLAKALLKVYGKNLHLIDWGVNETRETLPGVNNGNRRYMFIVKNIKNCKKKTLGLLEKVWKQGKTNSIVYVGLALHLTVFLSQYSKPTNKKSSKPFKGDEKCDSDLGV